MYSKHVSGFLHHEKLFFFFKLAEQFLFFLSNHFYILFQLMVKT